MTERKLFVTGGTGVLGRPTVRRLVEAGHDVTVAVRSEQGNRAVESLGARGVTVDLFDFGSVLAATGDADGYLHLATSIPPMAKMARRSAWRDNDRLRSETTAHLARAAREHGAEFLIAESITFLYPDMADAWIDESVAWPPAHPQWQSVFDLESEVAGFEAVGGRGVVARFGTLYGPEARSVDEALRMARLRSATLAGRQAAYVSAIHSDDAAAALAALVEAPAGVYNVVDDEPLTRREHLDAFSEAFGLRRLRPVPLSALKVAGGSAAEILARSQRVANAKLRETTGWAPVYGSVRSGWPAVAAARARRVA